MFFVGSMPIRNKGTSEDCTDFEVNAEIYLEYSSTYEACRKIKV